MNYVTPVGFRDVVSEEALVREELTSRVRACFAARGYLPVETPTLEVLDVMEADISAQSDFMRLKKLTALKETRQAYHEILAANDCLTLKDLKINGDQLKALGISEGKMIGAILNALLAQVLNNPELNEYEKLEELALKIYQEVQ